MDAVAQEGCQAAIARFVRASLFLAIQPNRPSAEANSQAAAGMGTTENRPLSGLKRPLKNQLFRGESWAPWFFIKNVEY